MPSKPFVKRDATIFMQVYIEYALLQNFIIDALLLCLALTLSKQALSWKRIGISALVGSLFAVAFPLFPLPNFLSYLLKFAFGFLLCLLVVKRKKHGGRYALTCIYFFSLSFLFGGALFAVFAVFQLDYSVQNGYIVESVPISLVLCGIIILAIFTLKWAKKAYFHRKTAHFYYLCEISTPSKNVKAVGFLDSGNTACFLEKPVCFISPALALELIEVGQVFDEMQIMTINGKKKVKLFKAKNLRIYLEKSEHIIEEIYLSPSLALQGRDYEVLLSPYLFEIHNV